MASEIISKVLAIVGPTASGKTRRAVDVAKAIDGEIISADSRQIYRGMDLGTGKDLEEYGAVPYHLIDIAPAGYRYNLYEYLRDARRAIADVESRKRVPVICGGTGLYVESLLKGMSMPEVPENPVLRESLEGKSLHELTAILEGMKSLHNTTDVDTAKRAVRAIEIQQYYIDHPEEAKQVESPEPLKSVVIGVDIDRDARRRRISDRLKARLDAGMTDEVEHLRHTYDPNLLYQRDPVLRRVLDQLKVGFRDGVTYEDLFQRLVTGMDGQADQYMVLADFAAYCEAESRMRHTYRDRETWNRMSLTNIARSGVFAADRAISQYADTIWHVPYKQ